MLRLRLRLLRNVELETTERAYAATSCKPPKNIKS